MLTYFNPQILARQYNDYQFPDEKTESQKGRNSFHNHSVGKQKGQYLNPASICLPSTTPRPIKYKLLNSAFKAIHFLPNPK